MSVYQAQPERALELIANLSKLHAAVQHNTAAWHLAQQAAVITTSRASWLRFLPASSCTLCSSQTAPSQPSSSACSQRMVAGCQHAAGYAIIIALTGSLKQVWQQAAADRAGSFLPAQRLFGSLCGVPQHSRSAYVQQQQQITNSGRGGNVAASAARQASYSALANAAAATPQEHAAQGYQRQQQQQRADVLDGRAVAAAWSEELQQQVPAIKKQLGRSPGLAVVLVGNRPDSVLYVSRKQEACARIGINCRILRLPETVGQAALQEAIRQLTADLTVDGVLIQLPLPRHLDEESVMESLDPRKDVDGFHPLSMGRMLMRGRARRFVPATPLGVVELLSRSAVNLAGKTAVVLGDSNIVGTPLAALLRDEGAALVTTCHRVSYQHWFEDKASCHSYRAQADVCLPRLPGPGPTLAELAGSSSNISMKGSCQGTSDSEVWRTHCSDTSRAAGGFQAAQLPAICRTADILVVAVGSPELVRGHWVKPGAVVVDVGINVVPSDDGTSSRAGGSSSSNAGVASKQYCGQQQEEQQHQQQLASCTTRSDDSAVQACSSCGSSNSSSIPCYKVVGDVANTEVAKVASVLTPVPGGVGPMTIAAVLHNTLQAARYSANILPW